MPSRLFLTIALILLAVLITAVIVLLLLNRPSPAPPEPMVGPPRSVLPRPYVSACIPGLRGGPGTQARVDLHSLESSPDRR